MACRRNKADSPTWHTWLGRPASLARKRNRKQLECVDQRDPSSSDDSNLEDRGSPSVDCTSQDWLESNLNHEGKAAVIAESAIGVQAESKSKHCQNRTPRTKRALPLVASDLTEEKSGAGCGKRKQARAEKPTANHRKFGQNVSSGKWKSTPLKGGRQTPKAEGKAKAKRSKRWTSRKAKYGCKDPGTVSPPAGILSEEIGLGQPPKQPPPTTTSAQLSMKGAQPPPTTTSTLLSLMARAVSDPKYTCVSTEAQAEVSPSSLVRSSWPLLRRMIAAPHQTALSIGSAPRQTLSRVYVEPDKGDDPSGPVLAKLEKEVKCMCQLDQGKPCWHRFDPDRLRKERLQHLLMNRQSLDLVLLAKIAANINRDQKTKKNKNQQKDRQRCRLCYFHEGKQICRETFLFLHGICKGRLSSLVKHYQDRGISARVHGNKANVPKHALSTQDSQRVLEFVRNYANANCVSSFGRKVGSKAGGGLLVLSPSQSKLYVHHCYKQWCVDNQARAVSLRSFQNLWTKHLPYIVVLRGSNKTPVPSARSTDPEFGEEEEDGDSEQEEWEEEDEWQGSALFSLPVEASQCGSHVGHSKTRARVGQGGRKTGRRKGVPPRKILEMGQGSLPRPSSQACAFGTHHTLAQHHLPPHPALGVCNTSGSSNNNDSSSSSSQCVQVSVLIAHDNIANTEQGANTPQTRHPDNSMSHLPQLYLSTSIPSSSSSANPSNVMAPGLHSVPMMLNKDVFGMQSGKPALPTRIKPPNLRPALYLPQPPQLLDGYAMPCADRFGHPLSSPQGLLDQSQAHTVLLPPHQAPDFTNANIHHLDWQPWPQFGSSL